MLFICVFILAGMLFTPRLRYILTTRKYWGKSKRTMKKLIHNSMANFSGSFVSELKESVTDAGTVLIFIVAVILYPMLYSIGYLNQTIRDIPVAVVDMDHSAMSRQYTRMLDATEQISVSCKRVVSEKPSSYFIKERFTGYPDSG